MSRARGGAGRSGDEAPELAEPDRVDGAPHPRETPRLFGHARAEARFLEAVGAGRLHHGWLISGPRGVGKATLAWRIARFLLAHPPERVQAGVPSLDIDPDHPVARRMAALAEPGLFLLRRAWDDKARPARLKSVITVDEVRKLRGFFGLSAPGGGRRVVIVDAADEMNANAANALLKLLEEPPENAVLLLVAHQPQLLLPTIRSRCRALRLGPLGAEDLAAALAQAGQAPSPDQAAVLAQLAQGSPGEALRLLAEGGAEIYARLVALLGAVPGPDRAGAVALADSCAGASARGRYLLTQQLILRLLGRLARAGAGAFPTGEAAPGEGELLARLSPDAGAARAWAELEQSLSARAAHGVEVNLDPAALILDMLFSINTNAARILAARGMP